MRRGARAVGDQKRANEGAKGKQGPQRRARADAARKRCGAASAVE